MQAQDCIMGGPAGGAQYSTLSRPWLLGERRTLERRLEERSSGRRVARMFTERSVQSSRQAVSLAPLHAQILGLRPTSRVYGLPYHLGGHQRKCNVDLIHLLQAPGGISLRKDTKAACPVGRIGKTKRLQVQPHCSPNICTSCRHGSRTHSGSS